MGYETLRVEYQDAIARVTVNRPEKLNALSRKVMKELSTCLEGLAGDDGVKAVILTGAGEKAFAAGADIEELANLTPIEAQETSARGQAILNQIESLPKPVIAAINGYALGGGCELALACTLRLAADTARLGLPEVKLGLIPGFGGTLRLPRVVGKAKALEMILTGESVAAEEALRLGLVHHVVPQQNLLPATEALARKIMGHGPVAVKLALQAVHRGSELPRAEGETLEAALFGLACATADMKEGTRAFVEKRLPRFTGK